MIIYIHMCVYICVCVYVCICKERTTLLISDICVCVCMFKERTTLFISDIYVSICICIFLYMPKHIRLVWFQKMGRINAVRGLSVRE